MNQWGTHLAYTLTEAELSRRLGIMITAPIRRFYIPKFEPMITALDPTYEDLPWDPYDVRQQQIELLLEHHSAQREHLLEPCNDYYAGKIDLAELGPFLTSLPMEVQQRIGSIKPFRRRAIATYHIERDAHKSDWQLLRQTTDSFTMQVFDYRKLPRVFSQMTLTAEEWPPFKQLLFYIADLVAEVQGSFRSLRIVVHQVATVARPGQAATNSPEGIHQDGSDFIVSALVISRNNINGGVSELYGPDRQTLWFSHLLLPSEGMFHADAGSPIWHQVTPIIVAVGSSSLEGTRNTLGFDIHIES